MAGKEVFVGNKVGVKIGGKVEDGTAPEFCGRVFEQAMRTNSMNNTVAAMGFFTKPSFYDLKLL